MWDKATLGNRGIQECGVSAAKLANDYPEFIAEVKVSAYSHASGILDRHALTYIIYPRHPLPAP